ncbi:MAG: TIGR03617 family F420-dependent LLM class oxidoreductase [Deltaproteobacteria bacterium]|nr:TIGR03617 family F420-dependent LLM class oxidoreductase [Deltaproteobacteria bacterium]
MKLDTGLAAASLKDVPEAARAAEEAGFDGAWTAETAHDAYLPLAIAAEHTTKLKLGTSIAVAFPRSPLAHAMLAWDLQAQSGGRFMLGLGTQVRAHNERRFGIKWEKPVKRLREMIQVIRASWDTFQNNTRPSFKGEFYEFTLMTPFFNPGPIEHPEIPIYIAGVNELMCRLAGELCDGFHVHPFHTVKYLNEMVLPNIEQGARKTGRSTSACKLSTSAFVIVGGSAEERKRMEAPVKQQIAFYASTPQYKAVLDAHGWGDSQAKLNDKARSGDWAGMADLITDEMLDVFAVTGTWDEIAGRIHAKYDGLLDRVGFYIPYRKGDGDDRWAKVIRAFHG